MIYNPSLPPPLLQTWLQLRGLAWGRDVTPPFRLQEFSALTGTSQSTIYGHMSLLRRMSTLSWRSTGRGMLIVSFFDRPSGGESLGSFHLPDSENSVFRIPDSRNLELPSHSLIPLSNSNLCMNPQQECSYLEFNTQDNHQLVGKGEFEGGRAGVGALEPTSQPVPRSSGSPPAPGLDAEPDLSSHAATLHAGPMMAYRHLVHLTPTPAQRRILAAQVSDLPLWQHTLEHWLGHGWNPPNLTGMLELYRRGGPGGCRYCHKTSVPTNQLETPLQHSLAALETLRREQDPSSSSGS
jgi:hypothetical protein